MTFGVASTAPTQEKDHFEPEPKDKRVVIDLINVNKDYDGVIGVREVNLRIYEKQITVLLGHNGAGKTTLLNLITGFAGCSSGQILIGNYDIKTCTRDARESIGYCPQNNILFDDLTVEEHVMFFALLKGIPRSKVRLEVVNLLNDVGLMAYKTAFPYEMTLGTQRRLSAALAILGSPKILVMDEPTSNMDADGRREMWQLLLQVRRNATVLLTTAILEEADVLGDRIVVMANGTIRYIGSPTFLKELFNTGYCLHINKYPKCKVAAIRKLLQKYAPKTKLRHNTNSEAVFMLGQAVSSRSLIAMFMDLEQSVDELRVESIGLSMKSLEDVLIKVGDQRHIRTRRATKPTLPKGSSDGDEDHLGANPSVVREIVTTPVNNPTLVGRVWAMFVKRFIHVYREERMPLFSWLMPLLLLTLMFVLEDVALRGTGHSVEQTSSSLQYTFRSIVVYSQVRV
ncbi:phospholipid-transporting ATPase ABCA3-like [Haemaphysalis longicornis]